MLYGKQTWPVKEKVMIRLEENEANMVDDACAKLGERIRFLQRNLGLD